MIKKKVKNNNILKPPKKCFYFTIYLNNIIIYIKKVNKKIKFNYFELLNGLKK